MNNLIFQYWEGKCPPGNVIGQKMMKEYANKIGVNHYFSLNPIWPSDARIQVKNIEATKKKAYYSSLLPFFDDRFLKYDYVLFCDCDIIPLRNANDNIFEEFDETGKELGICEEWMQPEMRVGMRGDINSNNDNKWAEAVLKEYGFEVPRTENNLVRVFNSGVVMYSREALIKGRENLIDFWNYLQLCRKYNLPYFYECDQPYLHAMLYQFDWTIMDYKWNSQMHYKPGTSGPNRPLNDYRTPETQFVHLQCSGADIWDRERIERTCND